MSRNQTLIERAKRVLKDEGLCQVKPALSPSSSLRPNTALCFLQGPTDAHNRDSNPREMQEAVAHLRKLEIVASFFDAYENGDNVSMIYMLVYIFDFIVRISHWRMTVGSSVWEGTLVASSNGVTRVMIDRTSHIQNI